MVVKAYLSPLDPGSSTAPFGIYDMSGGALVAYQGSNNESWFFDTHGVPAFYADDAGELFRHDGAPPEFQIDTTPLKEWREMEKRWKLIEQMDEAALEKWLREEAKKEQRAEWQKRFRRRHQSALAALMMSSRRSGR
jgi:hypothetical protein